MKNQTKIRLGLALGMVMVFSAAHADPQSGWYVGLRGGTATADVDQDALDAVQQDVFAYTLHVQRRFQPGRQRYDMVVVRWLSFQ